MKKTVVSLLSMAVIVFGLSAPVYAESEIGYKKPFEGLIQKLISKFNLNPSEVDKVVSDYRVEKQAENQNRMAEWLKKEVEKGNITEEQMTKIQAKHEEMRSSRPDMSSLTKEEKSKLMQENKVALEEWAKSNGIDIKYVVRFGQGRHGGGFWK